MKKLFGYAVGAAILAFPLISLAAEFRTGEHASTAAGENVGDDIYIAGGSINSAGSINGDFVGGGGIVIVSGPVSSDVTVGGGNVVILSSVGDDLRALGGSVLIQGRVGDDVIAGGGQVTIGGPGIGGDLMVGGGSVRLDAPVAGNVKIGGGNVYINSKIEGDIAIEADTVTLGSAAVIDGDLTYKASKELLREPGAVVNGRVQFEEREKKAPSAAAFAAIISAWVVGKFLVLFVCALAVGYLFKRYSRELVGRAQERPLYELGRGLLAFAALPVVSILLIVTVVGIPFGVIGLVGFVAAVLMAWVVTPIIVGSFLYRTITKRDVEVSWKTILLGAVVYSLIGVVPILGFVAKGLLTLVSLGAITGIKWGVVKQWR